MSVEKLYYSHVKLRKPGGSGLSDWSEGAKSNQRDPVRKVRLRTGKDDRVSVSLEEVRLFNKSQLHVMTGRSERTCREWLAGREHVPQEAQEMIQWRALEKRIEMAPPPVINPNVVVGYDEKGNLVIGPKGQSEKVLSEIDRS